MPLSPKVRRLLLQTCERYGVSPDLIDTAHIDPSLTYGEVKPVIEEMIQLLSPEYHPPPLQEAMREGDEIVKRQRAEVTAAVSEAISGVRAKHRDRKDLSLRDKFTQLRKHAEYFRADAEVLKKEEDGIRKRGGTIDYNDVLSVLEKQRGLLAAIKKAFREYPYLLHHLIEAENHIKEGIQLAEWNIGLIPYKPSGLTRVGVAVLRAAYSLENAHTEGIEKEF